jgi:hypothetical protein
MPVVNDYTALLSGSYWGGIEVTNKPAIVTYSFPTSAPAYLSGVDGFTGSTAATFQAFTTDEQTQAKAALSEWAAASGLTFIQVAPGKGDISFQLVDFSTTSYSGAGGIGFYPFGDWNNATYPNFQSDLDASGDVFMNSQDATSGQVTYGTLLHEIGHAIGLKHPTETVVDNAALPNPITHDQVLSSDDPTRTIMAEVGDTSGAPAHLRTLDMQAAAAIYGSTAGQVVTTSASGSNAALASWSWNATTQVLTETGFATADSIRGSSVNDVIYGMDGDDHLYGLNGADTLKGGAGNDVLNGGPGADLMYGGVGDDTFIVDNTGDRTYENANEGNDSVQSTVSYTLQVNVENLQLFGSDLTGRGNELDNTIYGDGAGANNLYGMAGNDYIVGGSGNDKIDGGTGADNMYGGAGNDTYYVDNPLDQVHEDANGGTDKVYASTSFALGTEEWVEYLYANAGTTAVTLTGNELANHIYGGSGNDTIIGGDGVDSLYGGAGDDRIVGGAGIDQLYGQGGSNTFVLTPTTADRDTIHDFVPGSDFLEMRPRRLAAVSRRDRRARGNSCPTRPARHRQRKPASHTTRRMVRFISTATERGPAQDRRSRS